MSEEQNGNGEQRPRRKQLAFCQEYVKDFNGAAAAKRAGYTGDVYSRSATACRLLKIDKVKSEIATILQSRCMSVDEALARLAEQARGAHSKYIRKDGTVNFEKLVKDKKAHLVKKLKYNKISGTLADIEFYDSQTAINLILRAQGAYQDKMDITSAGESITFIITRRDESNG
jgi:hypothetical protein